MTEQEIEARDFLEREFCPTQHKSTFMGVDLNTCSRSVLISIIEILGKGHRYADAAINHERQITRERYNQHADRKYTENFGGG